LVLLVVQHNGVSRRFLGGIGPQESVVSRALTTPDNMILGNEPRKRSIQRTEGIRALIEIGFEISGDKIRDSTASGNVEIRFPAGMTVQGERINEGNIIECDSMRVSNDGSKIFLQGEILVRNSDGGPADYTELAGMDHVGMPSPLAVVHLKSSQLLLEGRWSTTTISR
jgi:hypothetical protein